MKMQQFRDKLVSIVRTIAAPIDELRKGLMALEIILSGLLMITPGLLIGLKMVVFGPE